MKREVNKTRKGKIKEVTWIDRKAAYHSGVQLCKIILFIIVCLERRSLEFQRLCSRYLLRGSRHFLMCCSQIRDPGATLFSSLSSSSFLPLPSHLPSAVFNYCSHVQKARVDILAFCPSCARAGRSQPAYILCSLGHRLWKLARDK